LWLIEAPGLNALLGGGGLIFTRGLLDSLTTSALLAVAAWLCALAEGAAAGSVLAASIDEAHRVWDAENLRTLGGLDRLEQLSGAALVGGSGQRVNPSGRLQATRRGRGRGELCVCYEKALE